MPVVTVTKSPFRLAACVGALLYAAAAAATPGDPDFSFGGGGTVMQDLAGGDDFGAAVIVQQDGKPVVAGPGSDGSKSNFSLVRFNVNGTLDNSFNPGGSTPGIQSQAVGVCPCGAQAMALQSDGKILAAGYAGNGTDLDFALARYNSDGTLDTDNFNVVGTATSGQGYILTSIGSGTDQAEAMVLLQDGTIVLAGFADKGATTDFALTRYTKDGILDSLQFGTSGIVTTNISGDDKALAVVVQNDGKLVAAGYATGTDTNFALARYTAAGALDTSFNAGGTKPGTITTDFGSGNDAVQALVLQPDGKIIAVGGAGDGASSDFALARYNNNGTLDTTFNSGGTKPGTVTTDFSGDADKAYAAAIQPDGKIVVAGNATVSGVSGFAVARYNSDGTLDFAFNPGGAKPGTLVTAVGPGNATAKALALQPDGELVVAGYAINASSNNDFAAARYAAVDAPWQLTPDAFTFTDVNQTVVQGDVETSDPITISGLDAGVSVPVTVTGGQYAVGGSTAYTSQPGWVQNGVTVTVRHTAAAGKNNTTLTVGGMMAPNNRMTVLGTATSDTFSSTAISSGGGGALDLLSLAFMAAGLFPFRRVT
jgi:uncharacterized delta-60 repeat protein